MVPAESAKKQDEEEGCPMKVGLLKYTGCGVLKELQHKNAGIGVIS